MGFFWADSPADAGSKGPAADQKQCPVRHNSDSHKGDHRGCPVNHKGKNASLSSQGSCPVMGKNLSSSGGSCPVVKGGSGAAGSAGIAMPSSDDINPANNMPYQLPSQKAPGQKIDLPTEKTSSTIPKGEDGDEGVWEYPSPQQMFNAMIKKGKGDVPEEDVESMVSIHNFLNEGAWGQILEWEEPHTEQTHTEPRLLKFTGRPDKMSPRAKSITTLGKYFPEKFDPEPPFDRHDWTVLRADGRGNWNQVRYVIDYYSGPEEEGMPTFFLDVRPALDNFTNASDRFKHWLKVEAKPVWDKAMGKKGTEHSNPLPQGNMDPEAVALTESMVKEGQNVAFTSDTTSSGPPS